MEVTWPFLGLTDEHGREFGWCALVGPVLGEADRTRLSQLAQTRRIVGFTAFLGFPSWPPIGELSGAPLAWAHCLRSPMDLLPAGVPHALLPLSDFTDPLLVSREVVGARLSRDVDFVYVCGSGPAAERVKGWELARRCLPILVHELGLRGLLVGRRTLADLDSIDGAGRLEIMGELPWAELMRRFATSGFLFVPNVLDPAPRIIAEAMLMGTPVLVNRNILGGWHQVNSFTGAFFESEADVAVGARRCLSSWTSPRRWWSAHLGALRAGARLAELLGAVDPQARSVRRVHLSYRIDDAASRRE